MGLDAKTLPDNILRCMGKDSRPKGNAGLTSSEAQEKYQAGEEKRLQGDIANYLRLHGIWFDCDPMHKRRRGTPGAADFQFAYRGQACAVEAKTDFGKPSPDQVKAHAQMELNGWRIIVARSLSEVQSLLRSIDAEKSPYPL